jgi:hypothetical protein
MVSQTFTLADLVPLTAGGGPRKPKAVRPSITSKKVSASKPQSKKAPVSKPKKVPMASGEIAALSELIQELRRQNAELRTERDQLIKDKKAIAERVLAMHKRLTAELEQVQKEIKERVERRDEPNSIVQYMKAGFGTALGVIAAVLLMEGIEDLIDGGQTQSQAQSGSQSQAQQSQAQQSQAQQSQAQQSQVDAEDMLDSGMFGGGGRVAKLQYARRGRVAWTGVRSEPYR